MFYLEEERMPNRDWTDKTSEEKQSLYDRLKHLKNRRDDEMIARYREFGISMYESFPSYSSDVIETAPDGRLYIVRREGDIFVRVHEIKV
jgi:hypothetical protein